MTARGQGVVVRHRIRSTEGYALAVLLVSIAVMSVLMSVAMPVWKQAVQREKEEELVFRGEQYARAVGLFQRKFAGAFPPSLDVLVEQRFLRRKYKDPMVADGEFQILYVGTTLQPGQAAAAPGQAARPGQPSPATPATRPGQSSVLAGPRGGILGVASKSTEKSIRLYKGRNRYNEWQFVYTAATRGPIAPGRPGQTRPPGGIGPPGRPGQPGTTFGPGLRPGAGTQRPFGRPPAGQTPQPPQ